MVEKLRLPADFVVGQTIGGEGAGNQVLRDAIRPEGVLGAAVLIEAARAKALRIGVVHHHIRRDVPGEVAAALEARFGIAQVLGVEVVAEGRIVAAAGGCPPLEAAEARENAALIVVFELEMARAGRQRQYLRNNVEVGGSEESRLLGVAILVLVEGGIVPLDPRILYVRAGESTDVRDAIGIARRAGRAVRGAWGNVLVHPGGLVVELVILEKGAGDAAQTPIVRRAEAQFVLQVLVLFDGGPGGARRVALGGDALIVIGVHAARVIGV